MPLFLLSLVRARVLALELDDEMVGSLQGVCIRFIADAWARMIQKQQSSPIQVLYAKTIRGCAVEIL